MKTIQVTRYQASDGTLFDSAIAAEKHEAVCALATAIEKTEIYIPRDFDTDALALFLIDHYTMTPKP